MNFSYDVFGRVEQRELVAGDFVVELVVGQEATAQVDVGIDRDRLLALGEAAELGDALLVILLNVLARAGDGELVEQLEKCGIEPFQQFAGLAFGAVLSRPHVRTPFAPLRGFL